MALTGVVRHPSSQEEGSVEALLFVKERFDHHCKYLNFTDADEMFDNFDACLEGGCSDEVGVKRIDSR